jgi:hypothetical protein
MGFMGFSFPEKFADEKTPAKLQRTRASGFHQQIKSTAWRATPSGSQLESFTVVTSKAPTV